MAELPLVSVVVPTYNRAKLLAEAIDSVLAQSYPRIDLVVVDDGSTDESKRVVLQRFEPDKRGRYIRIDHSGFPGKVRNYGVASSRGQYIAFLDSDDLWAPDKIERQLEYQIDSGYRITHTREKWIRNGKTISQSGQRHRRIGDLYIDSLIKCVVGPSTVMMERTLFKETGGFRPDLEIAEDYEYWLRIAARHEFGYLDLPLTTKRAGHGDQLTEKYGHIEYFRIEALRRLVESEDFARLDREKVVAAKGELIRKCEIYSAGARKRGRLDEARVYERLGRARATE